MTQLGRQHSSSADSSLVVHVPSPLCQIGRDYRGRVGQPRDVDRGRMLLSEGILRLCGKHYGGNRSALTCFYLSVYCCSSGPSRFCPVSGPTAIQRWLRFLVADFICYLVSLLASGRDYRCCRSGLPISFRPAIHQCWCCSRLLETI